MILDVKDVTKSFGKKLILKSVSMHIDEGEFVSVFGVSGSGKTTLSRIIIGLEKADSGYVDVEKAMIVFQQPMLSLDPKQRIGEGLSELIRYHGFAEKNEMQNLIFSLLEKVGLKKDILSHYPHQISGGEAERICIARALLFNPKLLIMDEATSMLDPDTAKEIIALVKELIIKNDGSILFISHDKDLVTKHSDRIYVLDSGNIHEFINKKEGE